MIQKVFEVEPILPAFVVEGALADASLIQFRYVEVLAGLQRLELEVAALWKAPVFVFVEGIHLLKGVHHWYPIGLLAGYAILWHEIHDLSQKGPVLVEPVLCVCEGPAFGDV